jgi:hypothetical protein
MIVDTVELTPEDAAKLLAVSEGQAQRNVRKAAVERLAHAITSGQWRLTHQAIALDSSGVVLDGQHRLHAIVRAGVPVQVMIARDVPRSSFDVIDTGAVRSPSDVLRIGGHTNVNILAASARMVLTYDAVVGTTDTFNAVRPRFTSADILLEADSDRGLILQQAIQPAQSIAHTLGRTGFTTWLAALIVVLRTWPGINPSIAFEFLTALRDGVNLPPGSPILALRRFLSSDGGLIRTAGGERSQVGLATSVKAFNRWSAGDSSQLLMFRVGIERMPAPAPMNADPVSASDPDHVDENEA